MYVASFDSCGTPFGRENTKWYNGSILSALAPSKPIFSVKKRTVRNIITVGATNIQ